MASAYSTPKQFENYVAPVNHELVNFVLQSKEQKFNYNIAKVEQTLSDFGNLGLVRDEDKEYLADRINTMVSGMGDIENMDWSDSNIERQITTGIKGAIDEKVRKDIKLSRNYTSYLQQVQDIKEKDPEKYSDINFAMGLKLSGADEWARGEADDFNNLQYTPYTDVKGEQNEFIKEYIKTHGDERIEEYDDEINGVKVQRTIKGLSREQVESIWEANMTPNQRRQLQMESAYYAEQLPENQRPEVVKQYKNNLRQEIKVHKNTIDKLKGKLGKVEPNSNEAKVLQSQIQEMEGNIATIDSTINKPIDFQTAYGDSYYKMNKNAVVQANSFERVTDIDRDKTLLDAMKTNAQIAKLGRESQATEQAASGQNLTVAPSGGINGGDGALPVYTQQVQQELESSIDGLVASVGQATKDPSVDFFKTFGIEAHEFNKKTQKEKEVWVQSQVEDIEKGINMKSTGGYTPEVIDAFYNYKSSSTAFNEVNDGIKTASETVAKKSFDGMIAGYKGGDFKVNNFKNPIIKSIIKDAGDKDISFESLSSDERKAFRAAMIDESIRGGHIEQEELMPYILTNREQLIDSIEDESLKNQFLSNEEMTKSGFERRLATAGNAVLGVANAIGETFAMLSGEVSYDETAKAFNRAGELNRENNMRVNTIKDAFVEDETLADLNTRWTGERDLGDEATEDISNTINREYVAAVEEARQKAGEAAVKMPSTYVISLNPKVKGEENLSRKAQQRIAIDKGYGTDDLANNSVQVHYSKKDNTVQFSTVLRSSSQERYGLDGERVMSNPVPIDQLNDMPEIKNRIQRDDAPWALDSKNPNAAPVKFVTTGFADETERTQVINNKLAPIIGKQGVMRLRNSPHSIGYTRPKIKTMFQEKSRQTESGEQRRFVEEFPNTFQALAQGAGEFEVNYESVQDDGYYASVDYVVGDKRIPIQYPSFVGESIDYKTEFLNSFQRQKQIIDLLSNGYELGNQDVIDKLREIEEVYGQ